MSTNATLIRDLLARGMAGVSKANLAQQAIQEQRTGAYTLFVQAAILSEGPADLTAVADELFAEIRVSARVTDSEGNEYAVNAKPGKDGNGFVVPGSFSVAKSVMLDAITRGIPLTEDGQERSFTQIRKDVQAAKDAEAREAAKGDDRIRMDLLDMLADLTERAKDATSAELADLYKRVRKAHAPAKPAEAAKGAASEQASELAAAA